ncbi:porin, partial [Paraburkholderia xenovorans]|uniref:porin n=1 Tax=Paraburkholderia xenovorans TaxID=36873 RepID=UPI0038B7C488
DFLAPLTANGNWAGYLMSHPYDNDNTDNSFRLNNSVKYMSNTYGGFTFGGLYGFSNQAGGFANNRSYSLGAQYVGSAVTVAAAYMQINNPGGTTGGSLTTDDTNFFAGRERVWGAGINYTIGPAVLGFVYSHTNLNDATGSVYVGNFTNTASSLNSTISNSMPSINSRRPRMSVRCTTTRLPISTAVQEIQSQNTSSSV